MSLSFEDVAFLQYLSGMRTDFTPTQYALDSFGSQAFENIDKVIFGGYLETLTGQDRLKIYTIQQIKDVLVRHGIVPTKGKKDALIAQALESFTESETTRYFPISRYRLTDKGQEEIERYSLPLYARAVHCSASLNELQAIQDDLLSKGLPATNQDVIKEAQYRECIRQVRDDFAHYVDENVEEYEFMATSDQWTCEICAALDGKHFKVSEAQIGKNCPPMHVGCRCTTASYDSGDTNDWIAAGLTPPHLLTQKERDEEIRLAEESDDADLDGTFDLSWLYEKVVAEINEEIEKCDKQLREMESSEKSPFSKFVSRFFHK